MNPLGTPSQVAGEQRQRVSGYAAKLRSAAKTLRDAQALVVREDVVPLMPAMEDALAQVGSMVTALDIVSTSLEQNLTLARQAAWNESQ